MSYAIGFDVYGTLVNPLGMSEYLQPLVGDKADNFAKLWRSTQVEYSWRRALMQRYETFAVCTREALVFTMQSLGFSFSESQLASLMAAYQNLPAYEDAADALKTLQSQGHSLVAFSNGDEITVRDLLTKAGLLPYLQGVISVDDVRTFKPNPAVYLYLARRVKRLPSETWLVSSNSWDVMGAKSAGLHAAWIKRKTPRFFDPWDITPDIAVDTLEEFAAVLI
jgi:2-haloacid dehalogenase